MVDKLRLGRLFSCEVPDLCLSLCLAAINSARGEVSFGALGPLVLRNLLLRLKDESGLSILSILKSCALLTEDVLKVLENSFKVAAVRGVRSWIGSGGVEGGGGTLMFGTVSVSRTSFAGLGTSGLTSVTPFASRDFRDALVGTLALFSTRGPAPESCRNNLGLAVGACSSKPSRNVDLGALYSFAGD